MVEPKVDVIIPVRNGEKFISECLQSVLSQEFVSQIIIVDDGSTDMTRDIISKYKERDSRIEYHHINSLGLSSARNYGVGKSSSEYIAFLDSDDVWKEGKIRAHIDHVSQHEGCIFSFSNAIEVTEDRDYIRMQANTSSQSTNFESLLFHQFVVTGSGSSVVAQRKAFLNIGGFREDLNFGEDLDCWLKLATLQMPCEIPQYLVEIRNHQLSMSRVKKVGLRKYSNSISFLRQFEEYLPNFESSEKGLILDLLWQELRQNLFDFRLNFFLFPFFVKRNFPLTFQIISKRGRFFLYPTVLVHKLTQFLRKKNV
jgi:glycosyltransferase involved in cell wall biosynthesis